ncbi:MAG: hypothetical protein PHP54_05765 [Clostridia bacterium]|nr:hypothetical protein [Clostridia bacterium]
MWNHNNNSCCGKENEGFCQKQVFKCCKPVMQCFEIVKTCECRPCECKPCCKCECCECKPCWEEKHECCFEHEQERGPDCCC